MLVIEKAGLGGQAGITQTIDNFPGFDEGITGAEFAARLGRQAKKFGVEILQAQEVLEIGREGQYLTAEVGSEIHYHTQALLLASAVRRWVLQDRPRHQQVVWSWGNSYPQGTCSCFLPLYSSLMAF